MKIITDNAVYVQKNDIAYLLQTNLEIPAAIFTQVFERGITIIDDSNRYEFVRFTTPEVIDFFRNIHWIIDYNEIKDLSEKEILALGQSIAQEQNTIASRFNSMSSQEKQANSNLVSQCELFGYKIYALRDFLWFKQGHLQMKLPKGIDMPTDYVQEKGVKRFIKTIFNKQKN